MKDKKVILFASIIVITLVLLALVIVLLVKDNKKDTSKQVYGVIVEKGSNYVLVQDDEDKKYYVAVNDDVELGTFVSVYYEKNEDVKSGNGKLDVVLNSNEVEIIPDITTTKETKLDHDEYATRTTTTTSTVVQTKSTTTTYKYTKKLVDEGEVLTFAEDSYMSVNNDTGTLEKAKEHFIMLVDFIFYDGEIKGKRFDELTSSAKAKVVYYTLMMDAKIDSKWPGYKENIQSKYKDIKAKLIAKYMDLTTSVCETSSDNCAQAKEDFKLMKESVNLTWNTLKDAFSYAITKGKDALVNWYEIFSGKR